jgi:uncharacterized Zn-finger protein
MVQILRELVAGVANVAPTRSRRAGARSTRHRGGSASLAKMIIKRIKKPPTLCRLCVIMRDQPIMAPTHLVHPIDGEPMLFDVRGEAVCPDCGARYRRTLNVIALLE